MNAFNPLNHPIGFSYPSRLAVSAWTGHVPFAMFLIDILRPRIVVELGTHYGVSYCAFCQAVKELKTDTRCYAIDTWQGDPQAGFFGPEVLTDLKEHHDPLYGGFSRLIQTTFDEAATHFGDGTVDLLHIDGYHTYEAVKQDFEIWLPKMSGEGVILFHDINVREGDFGVWRFWEEIKPIYPHFEFIHSHGLGLLVVGRQRPEPLQNLLNASNEELARIREIFHQLGARLEMAQELQVLRRAAKEPSNGSLKLQEKDQQIQAINEQLKIKEQLIREKESLLQIKDHLICQRDEQLRGKDQVIQAKEQQLQEKDGQLQAKDRQIQEKDHQLQIKDQLQEEKEQQLQDKEGLIQQQLGLLQKKDHQLEAKERLILERERELETKEQVVQRMGRKILGKGQQIQNNNYQLQIKGRQLREKDEQLRGKDQVIQAKEQQLQEKDGQLQAKDRQIQEKDHQLQIKDQLLLEGDRRLRSRDDQVIEFSQSGSYQLGRALSWPLRKFRQQSHQGANNRHMKSTQMPTEAVHSAATPPEPSNQVAVVHHVAGTGMDYKTWVERYDTLTGSDRQAISIRIENLKYKPVVSIAMPVYNVDETWLRHAIDSVFRQLYPYWELCIADDNSSQPHVRPILEEYAHKDSRVKVVFRKKNGHISTASNSALELASGEFVALLDNDDVLPEHALYMVVEELNAHPETDLIYSDEDKIDDRGERLDPHFKPDWSPDTFYSFNLISHLGVYRASIIRKIGGFRKGYEGSQDYDLALRFIEQIPADHIRHIPHILYHWRAIPGSVALATGEKDYVHEAARRAIRSHLKRTGISATVTEGHNSFHRVIYPVPTPSPLVSLIIGTRDRLDLLRQAVEGILKQTNYHPLELLIVDNQSVDPATLAYFHEIKKDPRVMVLKYDAPFNFSAMNNLAVLHAKGEIIGLINNDIKIASSEWLSEMVSHAIRPPIGAVGAKLHYADDTVQHAGVIIGLGGVAGHAHQHFSRHSPGYFNRAKVIQNYSAVTAACLMMRRHVFDEVGGLDEVNLAVAFNDVDLCLRIREKGYRILWTPYAELYHLESASRGSDTTPDKLPRFISEQEFMKSKWENFMLNDPCYNQNLTLNKQDFSLAFPPRTSKPWVSREVFVNTVAIRP